MWREGLYDHVSQRSWDLSPWWVETCWAGLGKRSNDLQRLPLQVGGWVMGLCPSPLPQKPERIIY